MAWRTKLKRRTLLFTDAPIQYRDCWHGVWLRRQNREALEWCRSVLRRWPKRKRGISAALMEHPDVSGVWW